MMIKLTYLPGKLLVGLSGGADSVALVHLLLDAGCDVAAVHVNHGLRGDASDGDEAFVRTLCEALNVPLMIFRADPPENPGEGWAREARYGFFRQAMAETGADALVLAHHRDDQAETLLLHLLRGAGLTGLTGMAADATLDGVRILRPMLTYSRAQIRAYLTERGITWREDASNGDARYLRNALRLEVLPVLDRLAPGASARMAMTASLLQEDDAALNALAMDFLAEHPGLALPLEALRNQPIGLQKRVLRAWWTAHAPQSAERSLSAAQTESLLALLDAPASARCNLPQGWHGQRGWTHIHLVSPEEASGIPDMPAQACSLLAIEPFAGFAGERLDGEQAACLHRHAACSPSSLSPANPATGGAVRRFPAHGWRNVPSAAGERVMSSVLSAARAASPCRTISSTAASTRLSATRCRSFAGAAKCCWRWA